VGGVTSSATVGAVARGNGPAHPDEVIASVRERLGWASIAEPDPHPAEVIPPDPLADLSESLRLLRQLP
jgi:hypothetical protein